ncbi:MAG: hypothetical protein EAY75_17980 [Bacteroidetes bacterium]|nr:MAG: hypothetical protein EAY75_17980 [Bacteroidota bacterium]
MPFFNLGVKPKGVTAVDFCHVYLVKEAHWPPIKLNSLLMFCEHYNPRCDQGWRRLLTNDNL